MKKGLTQICLGGRSRIEEGLAICREAGYEGLEILLTEAGDLTLDAGPRDYEAVRALGRAAGVVYTSLCGAGSLIDDDSATVARSKAQVRKMLEAAEALGADAVLVTGGAVTPTLPYDTAYARLGEALRDLAPEAERRGVSIALENVWNRLLLSPLEFRDFLDAVGSTHVGAYFDTGNVVLFGYPEQWIRILGSRIRKVHFKDFKMDHGTRQYEWTQLCEGAVDWPAVMRALREIGYDDYVITEVCGDREVYAETSRAMDAILALE